MPAYFLKRNRHNNNTYVRGTDNYVSIERKIMSQLSWDFAQIRKFIAITALVGQTAILITICCDAYNKSLIKNKQGSIIAG